MPGTFTKQALPAALSFLLVVTTTPFEAGAQAAPTGYSGQGVPYTQHRTTAQGSVGSVQTSAGGKGVAAAGAYGNSAAAAQTANGNKYAAANGNAYKNTGSGWEKASSTGYSSA